MRDTNSLGSLTPNVKNGGTEFFRLSEQQVKDLIEDYKMKLYRYQHDKDLKQLNDLIAKGYDVEEATQILPFDNMLPGLGGSFVHCRSY